MIITLHHILCSIMAMSKYLKSSLVFIFFGLLSHGSLWAQPDKVNAGACDPTQNKAAEKVFARAMKESEEGLKRKGLREALELEPGYYEAAYQLGRRAYFVKRNEEALAQFEIVTRLNSLWQHLIYPAYGNTLKTRRFIQP